jgi:hypothetical protein
LQGASGISFLAAEQALRVIVQFREGAPLGAGIAFEQRVVRVAADVSELSGLDRGEDATVGDAQAAYAGTYVFSLRGGGHGRLGHRSGLGYLLLMVSQGS